MITSAQLLAVTMAIAAAAACRQGTPSGTDAARTGRSMVRVVNALPSGKKVDVTGDDRTLFSGVNYKQVTPYAQVRDSLIALRALAADDNQLLADDREMMLDGVRYTALILPGDNGATQIRVVRDDVAADPGKARIRVINASPSVKSADFAVLGEKAALFQGADFTDEAGYKDVAPATITLDVRVNAKSVKPMILKPVHLEAGKAYTIVILGGRGAPAEAINVEDGVSPPPAPRGN